MGLMNDDLVSGVECQVSGVEWGFDVLRTEEFLNSANGIGRGVFSLGGTVSGVCSLIVSMKYWAYNFVHKLLYRIIPYNTPHGG